MTSETQSPSLRSTATLEERRDLKKAAEKKLQKEKDRIAKEKESFVNLFVASLKGQDPTSPMDHSQLSSMMLSFQNTSTLMDIKTLLHTQFASDDNKLSDATKLLGQGIMTEGNDFELVLSSQDGKPRGEISYELAEEAAEVLITIKDANGNIVSEAIESDQKNKGKNTFTWDGSMIEKGSIQPKTALLGKYRFEVKAIDAKGDSIEVTTFSSMAKTITDVSYGKDGDILLSTQNGMFKLNEILSFRNDQTSKILEQVKLQGINIDEVKAKFSKGSV